MSEHEPHQAARLLGAADALLADLGSELLLFDREHHARTTAAVRAQLGDAVFAAIRKTGQSLSLDEVTALAEARRTPA
ncbi:MAG TPA: hypothetical protein VF937_12535 [Chloroflexota bacterium]